MLDITVLLIPWLEMLELVENEEEGFPLVALVSVFTGVSERTFLTVRAPLYNYKPNWTVVTANNQPRARLSSRPARASSVFISKSSPGSNMDTGLVCFTFVPLLIVSEIFA